MLTAISSGVSPPSGSPIGQRTRSSWAGVAPSSARSCSKITVFLRRLPIRPRYASGSPSTRRSARRSVRWQRVTTATYEEGEKAGIPSRYSASQRWTSPTPASRAAAQASARSSTISVRKPTEAASLASASPTCPAPNTTRRGPAPAVSRSTSAVPPHAMPRASSPSSRNAYRFTTGAGSVSLRRSPASFATIASKAPPPIVPKVVPSERTSILAPTVRGVDPVARTTVATTARRPDRISSRSASRTSRIPLASGEHLLHVEVHDEAEEDEEEDEAHLCHPLLDPVRQIAAEQGLGPEDQDVAAVQDRDREEVQDAELEADQREDVEERLERLHRLPRDLGDADRAGESPERDLPAHELREREEDAPRHRAVERERLPEGLSETEVPVRRGRPEVHADPALAPLVRRSDRNDERLAFALHPEPDLPAGARQDHGPELGLAHRRALVEAEHLVADLQARAVRGRSPDDLVDRRGPDALANRDPSREPQMEDRVLPRLGVDRHAAPGALDDDGLVRVG